MKIKWVDTQFGFLPDMIMLLFRMGLNFGVKVAYILDSFKTPILTALIYERRLQLEDVDVVRFESY